VDKDLPKLYIVSRKCLVLLWVSCFNKSMLKSPHKNIVLIDLTSLIFRSKFSQNVSIGDPGVL